MKTKHPSCYSLVLILFALVLISSCDDDVVGKWEPMKWDYENVTSGIKITKPSGKDKDHAKYDAKIEVSESGSLDIICKNYNGFWFAEYPDMSYEDESLTHFSTENCDMKIEGNTIHCQFINIDDLQSEDFTIVVTAGDIFFHFIIDIN